MVATEKKRRVRERPINFTDQQVRALLEGKVTQTWRPIRPQPTDARSVVLTSDMYACFFQGTTPESPGCSDETIPRFPWGRKGDRLWVRENYATRVEEPDFNYYPEDQDEAEAVASWVERTCVVYRATPRIGIRFPGVIRPVDRMRYLDDSTPLKHHSFGWPIRWTSRAKMPRQFSRITLEITNVRVERLWRPTLEDIDAMGIPEGLYQSQWSDGYARHKDFRVFWDNHYGTDFPWESNPWVWVIEFKKVEV